MTQQNNTDIHVALALGTNMGVRIQSLRHAVEGLSSFVHDTHLSPVYETPAAYVTDQPDFYNMTLTGRTQLAPEALLKAVKDLEHDLGRRQSFRYGPRLIDIDIIFYGQQAVNLPNLTVPHALMHEREFVLRPLNDIAPDWVHTVRGQTVAEMLTALKQDAAIAVGPLHKVGAGE
ncbi:MAG: 2-amino-4-hydroxy-6-hydroxymethyldihydropteridine diphosphokinase [Alphaproteobacteria bacterium]|nr:2-amino-4-hydroxy-6-hydroxymethyldihydropteridine diphosphokinase [Alphaproteobacteria bacterium]MBV8549637.1 2-amino-4-hydroxy-6-hydroxymethyldihydropteridine diphosphokinase [Alphaproteobacteria bacterium]